MRDVYEYLDSSPQTVKDQFAAMPELEEAKEAGYFENVTTGAFYSAFRYGMASNFTSFARTKLTSALNPSGDTLTPEQVMDEYGFKTERNLTREQAEHSFYVKDLEKTMAIAAKKGGLKGTVAGALGTLAGHFLDPVGITLAATGSLFVGAGLKALGATKLIQIMHSSNRVQKLAARGSVFGSTDAFFNVQIGKGVASQQDREYTQWDLVSDVIFGAVFGTVFSPIGLPKHANTKIKPSLPENIQSQYDEILKSFDEYIQSDGDVISIFQELSGRNFKGLTREEVFSELIKLTPNKEKFRLLNRLVEESVRSDDYLEFTKTLLSKNKSKFRLIEETNPNQSDEVLNLSDTVTSKTNKTIKENLEETNVKLDEDGSINIDSIMSDMKKLKKPEPKGDK